MILSTTGSRRPCGGDPGRRPSERHPHRPGRGTRLFTPVSVLERAGGSWTPAAGPAGRRSAFALHRERDRRVPRLRRARGGGCGPRRLCRSDTPPLATTCCCRCRRGLPPGGGDAHPGRHAGIAPPARPGLHPPHPIVTPPEAPVHEAEREPTSPPGHGIAPYAWVINQSLLASGTTDPVRQRGASELPSSRVGDGNPAPRCALVPWAYPGAHRFPLDWLPSSFENRPQAPTGGARHDEVPRPRSWRRHAIRTKRPERPTRHDPGGTDRRGPK